MKYSISEASRIVGVTRKTLYKHIDKKPISTEQDENGRPVIDASELMRVYGDKCRFDQDKPSDQSVSSKQESTDVSTVNNVEIAVTKKELELLREQISTEREQFEEQIEYLRKKLDESTSESRKLTALITDQTKKSNNNDDWKQSIKALEDRIANQEKENKEKTEREAKEREEIQKQLEEKEKLLKEQEEALELEKHKSFIHRMLGR